MRFFLTAILLLPLTGSARSADIDIAANEAIVPGAIVQNHDIWLCGMNLQLRKDQPATLMGMVKCTHQPRAFSYVFIIRGDEGRAYAPAWTSEPKVTGNIATETDSVDIGGSRVEYSYSVELDPKGKKLPHEVLVINGVRTDPKGGRVFLIDCSGKQVVWQQLDVRVPAPPLVPVNAADVDRLAKQIVKHLQSDSPVITGFLRKN